MDDKKMIIQKEREREAIEALAVFSAATPQEQQAALAFIQGVQFGAALAQAEAPGA